MNTKTFAQQSRIILMQGVERKLRYWGFSEKGEVTDSPVKIEGGYTFRGDVFDDTTTPGLWQSMKMAIDKKGFDVVKEEAAYTWFNRMVAIHILAKNGYEQSQLDYARGMQHTPMILQRARQGFYDFLNPEEKHRLKLILPDYSQDQLAFTILLIGYCHSHTLLSNVFGGINDYTELLLPDNMLSDNGFIHLLNTTDAITDEQYQEVELIGWLYQFYISEKKAEVFAGFKKNKKAETQDIPAATQFFTPNWVVKYMVQNTVGKLWLDLHPGSPLKKEMKYLVESENAEYGNPNIKEVKELKLLDPASGSGHILVEGFGLLFKMYKEEYYSDEEAVESILSNNLFGLDIDKRAVQLAQFAVLLKAAKVFPAVLKKGWLPRIYAMPEPYTFSRQEVLDFLGSGGVGYEKHLSSILTLMQQAQNLGSIMLLDLPKNTRNFIVNQLKELRQKQSLSFHEQALLPRITPFIEVYTIMSSEYEAVSTNPPYMGTRNMNNSLKTYIETYYSKSKRDLYCAFIEACFKYCRTRGYVSMITQLSWMFINDFYEFRNSIIDNYAIMSCLELGSNTFDEISGEVVKSVTFCIEKSKVQKFGNYYDLSHYNNSSAKNQAFLKTIHNPIIRNQFDFYILINHTFCYWISKEAAINLNKSLIFSDLFAVKQGLATGENERFLRNWPEVSFRKIQTDRIPEDSSNFKWFPYDKGGGYRKWYGNNDLIVNWENDGNQIRNFKGSNGKLRSRPQNINYFFKEGITFNLTGTPSFRYKTIGHIFDVQGSSIFPSREKLLFVIAFLNSKVANSLIKITNPTMVNQVGDINNIYFLEKKILSTNIIKNITSELISTSESDWNSRETSWEFQQQPLLLLKTTNLEQCFQVWLQKSSSDFFQLYSNEEELNRIFIEIYGLQDELNPEVSLKEITILQDELDYNALEQLQPPYEGQLVPVKKDVLMLQLISYAIGCFMGRYRLDTPGLHIAHPNPTKEETTSYKYKGHSFEIDDDAIIPIMGSACDFPDDAVNRFKNFLDIVWGANTRIENLNFLQECLNQDVEKIIVKDFWKVHCRMYNKKPIYWLFSSPKGAFQVLAYMHRMNAFTVEKIRSKYLIDHLKSLRSKISLMEKSESSLNAQDSRVLDKHRKDLQECEQYDMALKPFADKQITFDLDDGVTENYKLFKGIVAEIK